jgi:hypothetical protein
MTNLETEHLDPFALAGRSADITTVSEPDCASARPEGEVRIAALVGSGPAQLPPTEPAMPDTYRVISPGSADERFDFAVAEAALVKFRADAAKVAGDDGAELYSQVDRINFAQPRAIADVAVKLRVLADDNIGVIDLIGSTTGGYEASLKQIAAFVDEKARTGAGEGALFAPTSERSAAALFEEWLALRGAIIGDDDEEEAARIGDEEIRLEGDILRAEPVTIEDWKAIVAVLVSEGANVAYANMEALENLHRQLIIDRIHDPAKREKQLRWSQRRVRNAKAVLEELESGDLTEAPAPMAKLDFVAAESEMAALIDLSEEFADAGDDSDETLEPIMARWRAMETAICREAPASLPDAAVKLRVLAATGGGMEASESDEYTASLAQVLAFLDDLLRRREFDVHESVAGRISELRELSRSTGDRAEATDHEVDILRLLLSWVESKVRRSMTNWPGLRERLAERFRSGELDDHVMLPAHRSSDDHCRAALAAGT